MKIVEISKNISMQELKKSEFQEAALQKWSKSSGSISEPKRCSRPRKLRYRMFRKLIMTTKFQSKDFKTSNE